MIETALAEKIVPIRDVEFRHSAIAYGDAMTFCGPLTEGNNSASEFMARCEWEGQIPRGGSEIHRPVSRADACNIDAHQNLMRANGWNGDVIVKLMTLAKTVTPNGSHSFCH
jgi:hypothetical protein